MKKTFFCGVLIVLIILFGVTAQAISEGDRVLLGTYDGNPISWKCVRISENGIYLISEKVLFRSSFDIENENEWDKSQIRDYLNNEFLNGFSENEKNSIANSQIKSVINCSDNVNEHIYFDDFALAQQNIDNAYSVETCDKVFLPSILEIAPLYAGVGLFGADFYMGKDEVGCYVPYYLRDSLAFSVDKSFVRCVEDKIDITYKDGEYFNKLIRYTSANNSNVGIRPALYLKNDALLQKDVIRNVYTIPDTAYCVIDCKSEVVPIEKKVRITAGVGNCDDYELIYYVNGEGSDLSVNKYYDALISKTGINTIYACVIKDGVTVARSNEITVNGIDICLDGDIVYNMDEESRPQNCISSLDDGEVSNVSYIIDDTESGHGCVAKIETANLHTSKKAEIISKIEQRKYFNGKIADYISMTYDIKISRIDKGECNVLFNYSYYDSVSGTNGEKAIPLFTFGADNNLLIGKSKTITYQIGEWYNVEVIIDSIENQVYFLVDEVVYCEKSFIDFASDFNFNIVKENICYLNVQLYGGGKDTISEVFADNHSLAYNYYHHIEVSHSFGEIDVFEGCKGWITASVDGASRMNYYQNGKLIAENTSSLTMPVTAMGGINTYYAELIDDYGGVIDVSNIIFIYAIPAVSEKLNDITFNETDKSWTFTPSANNTTSSISLFESEDSYHEMVAKMQLFPTNDVTIACDITPSYSLERVFSDTQADILSVSVDVKPIALANESLDVLVHYWNKDGVEKAPVLFSVTNWNGDSKLQVRNSFENQFKTINEDDVFGKWYNLKAIFNFVEEQIYLLVNDALCSVIPFGSDENTPDIVKTKEQRLYLQPKLKGYGAGEKFEAYVDNFEMCTITTPIAYRIICKNKDNIITNLSQIKHPNPLDISFTLQNKGREVYCFAVVLREGVMYDIDCVRVNFDDNEKRKEVALKLDSIPVYSESSDYTIEVYIWDSYTFEPLIQKNIIGQNINQVNNCGG